METVQNVLNPIKGNELQSKNIFRETFELVYKVNKKEAESYNLIQRIQGIQGIHGVNILAPETEIM